LDSYTSDTTAVIEVPLITKYDNASILLKPLRRGSININTSNPSAGPVINLGVLTNPVDLKINLEAYSSGYMASLGPIETSPGVDVVSDEAIIAWIHESVLPSATHPCGTAAMMAREVGGVGSDLLVHGVGGLSVVDASVMPLIPGTHFSATVYAAAEKVSVSVVIEKCVANEW
jgi:choline dehydrogenase-like flavoprotein